MLILIGSAIATLRLHHLTDDKTEEAPSGYFDPQESTCKSPVNVIHPDNEHGID